MNEESISSESMDRKGALWVPKHIADSAKAEELDEAHRAARRAERRRRRLGEPVVCSICKKTGLTLYNLEVFVDGEVCKEKRCAEHL